MTEDPGLFRILYRKLRMKKVMVTYVENTTPVLNNWHEYYNSNTNKPIERNRIIEKTYVKLREASLNYSLPKSIVEKVRLIND